LPIDCGTLNNVGNKPDTTTGETMNTEYAEMLNTHLMSKVQARAIDVAALASGGCDAGTLSLAIGDLRDMVSEFAQSARDLRKEAAK
jgi:hypothetical protein